MGVDRLKAIFIADDIRSSTVLNAKSSIRDAIRLLNNYLILQMNGFFGIFKKYSRNRDPQCLMFDLDAAAKTTILCKLKFGEPVTTIPTLGFNVETIEYRIFNLKIEDINRQDLIRALSLYYFHYTQQFIFVIDSNDISSIDETRDEMRQLLDEDELCDVILFVYANKQELPNESKSQEFRNRLRLNVIITHPWQIRDACATICDGSYKRLN
jgi:GTPase SAR1 family protein